MADYYRCLDCGAIFKVEDSLTVEECVGEFWGQPAYERWAACPHCKSTDLEEYKGREYWVSYTLQDGTQTGATLTVNDAGEYDAYDEIEEQLKEMHGDMLADIADYGAYDDLD